MTDISKIYLLPKTDELIRNDVLKWKQKKGKISPTNVDVEGPPTQISTEEIK